MDCSSLPCMMGLIDMHSSCVEMDILHLLLLESTGAREMIEMTKCIAEQTVRIRFDVVLGNMYQCHGGHLSIKCHKVSSKYRFLFPHKR
jgi:hypothetical protein